MNHENRPSGIPQGQAENNQTNAITKEEQIVVTKDGSMDYLHFVIANLCAEIENTGACNNQLMQEALNKLLGK